MVEPIAQGARDHDRCEHQAADVDPGSDAPRSAASPVSEARSMATVESTTIAASAAEVPSSATHVMRPLAHRELLAQREVLEQQLRS